MCQNQRVKKYKKFLAWTFLQQYKKFLFWTFLQSIKSSWFGLFPKSVSVSLALYAGTVSILYQRSTGFLLGNGRHVFWQRIQIHATFLWTQWLAAQSLQRNSNKVFFFSTLQIYDRYFLITHAFHLDKKIGAISRFVSNKRWCIVAISFFLRTPGGSPRRCKHLAFLLRTKTEGVENWFQHPHMSIYHLWYILYYEDQI